MLSTFTLFVGSAIDFNDGWAPVIMLVVWTAITNFRQSLLCSICLTVFRMDCVQLVHFRVNRLHVVADCYV